MAVAPDLLLSSATEVRPKAAPKSSTAAVDATPGRPSSFAKVLADERQASFDAGRQADARGASEAHTGGTPSQNTDGEAATPSAPSAAGGNPLPLATEGAEAADPLALLGLGIELDAESAPPAEGEAGLLVDGESELGAEEQAVDPIVAMPSAAVVSSEVLIDPEVEKLNSAASVQVSLDMAKKAETDRGLGKTPAVAGNAVTSVGDSSEAAAKGLGGLKADAQIEVSADADIESVEQELSARSLESLKIGGSESSADSQAARLNQLGQAVAQAQAAQAPRILVPGQPLAMQQPGISEAVVDRVMWLSSQNLRSAEIQLDPAELGRLDIRVSLNQDQAQVSFASPHAAVREALESQMHRMRELFAQQGLNQVDVSVSDQSLARHSHGQQDSERSARGNGVGSAEETDEVLVSEVRNQPATLRGLVDFYA